MYDNQRLWDMGNAACVIRHVFFPPVPLCWRSEPPLVSCPAGMLAKLIGLLQIRQRHCSRNISPFSPFSLCSRSPGSLEGIEALRTQHKSHFLHCLASTSDFFSFSPLMPHKGYMSIFSLMWNFLACFKCVLSNSNVTFHLYSTDCSFQNMIQPYLSRLLHNPCLQCVPSLLHQNSHSWP